MAKVKRSTPAPAAPVPAATAAKPTRSARTAAKASAAAAANVIEIPSSPDHSVSGDAKGCGSSNKKARKRPAPQPLDLDDEVQMWTPREKQRLDEDCQILAGEPLDAAEVGPAPASAADDDIAVVAERGQVACRDYPHPRYACAKHPFNTTPHERHCDKCFCYVCDVAAPCVSWKGRGGHCLASDKDKKWKTMRFMRKKSTQAKPS